MSTLGFKAFYSGKQPIEITTAKSIYFARKTVSKVMHVAVD